MSGSAFIFDNAKGKVAYLASLQGAYGQDGSSDALLWVTLGVAEADAVLRLHATLAALKLGSNTELSAGWYSRVASLTSAVNVSAGTVTVDDTTDPVWSPTTDVAVVKVVCCYRPATGSADSAIIPLFADSFDIPHTPTSGTITYQVNASGFFSAS